MSRSLRTRIELLERHAGPDVPVDFAALSELSHPQLEALEALLDDLIAGRITHNAAELRIPGVLAAGTASRPRP